MSETDTQSLTKPVVATTTPWNVIVHNDNVNLPKYVTFVFMKIFGYSEQQASVLMLQVHRQGRSIVWTGEREKAELYVQQLQAHQLRTSLEKAE